MRSARFPRSAARLAAAILLATACGSSSTLQPEATSPAATTTPASAGAVASTGPADPSTSASPDGAATVESTTTTAVAPSTTGAPAGATSPPLTATGPGHLAPGSDPSVLPGPLLIADRGNNRLLEIDPEGRTLWEFPQSGDLAPGETFRVPDDAFFTPDGRQIIATEEDDFAVSLVDIATRKVVWRYGTPGHHGSGDNQLWNPDDAIVLPNGDVMIADIKNCRILLVAAGAHTPKRIYGTTGLCGHQPPDRYGSPNGAFPLSNGHYLVTEIRGAWVDEIDLAGNVFRSIHVPQVAYPSDTNEVSPGVYLTVDYSRPGAITTFDDSGQALWRYAPTGAEALRKPSLAKPLPNGMVISNDDFNHRVIVVDPKTNTVVWQYGQTGVPGTDPGLLRIPDGLDLAPPYSLAGQHAATMSTLP